MCIIIYAPANAERPGHEALSASWATNSDGAGFMYAEDGKLIVKKGFMCLRDFHRAWKKIPEKVAVVAHFRIGTHGPKNAALTHPFVIHDDKLAVVHNGILSIKVPKEHDDIHSDTSWFTEAVLRELEWGWHKKGSHKFLIESFLSSNNKLVVMDHEGHVEIYNETAGHWDEGVWYSNYSYRRYTPPTTTISYRYGEPHRIYPLDEESGYSLWDELPAKPEAKVQRYHRHGNWKPKEQTKIGFDQYEYDDTPTHGTVITPSQDDPAFQAALNSVVFKDLTAPLTWAEAAEAAELNIISWADFASAYQRGYVNAPQKEERLTTNYAKFREAMKEYWKIPWKERQNHQSAPFKGQNLL